MRILFALLILTSVQLGLAQNMECLAFYNLENLFDTYDDSLIIDEEYLPENGWTEDMYRDKIARMAEILSLLGQNNSTLGPSFIGLCEIENRKVLEDLVRSDALKSHNYQILHFDGPDRRGVDVAALYKVGRFTPMEARAIPVVLMNEENERKFTRDVLYVKGLLGGEIVHITVNHWPSRYGGKAASSGHRETLAALNRKIIDSLCAASGNCKFIVMGDFNDDPPDKSVKEVLRAENRKSDLHETDLFNPFYKLHQKGIGSNAYDDSWNNFDQIIISAGFIEAPSGKWQYDHVRIFKKDFMLRPSGQYKGYPLRTKAGGQYINGYSDHFPVVIYFKRQPSGH